MGASSLGVGIGLQLEVPAAITSNGLHLDRPMYGREDFSVLKIAN